MALCLASTIWPPEPGGCALVCALKCVYRYNHTYNVYSSVLIEAIAVPTRVDGR